MPPVPTALPRDATSMPSRSCACDDRRDPAGPVARRRAGVERVDVAEQQQRVRVHQVRDQGGEAVVVAEPDLVGGHGVVLVDDGHDPEVEQPRQRPVRVAVVHAPDGVVGGQQHLPDLQPVPGERRRVVRDEQPLPDGGGRLLRRQVPRAGRQPERAEARRRSRRRTPARPARRRRGARRARRPARSAAPGASRPSGPVSDDEPILTTTRDAETSCWRSCRASTVTSRILPRDAPQVTRISAGPDVSSPPRPSRRRPRARSTAPRAPPSWRPCAPCTPGASRRASGASGPRAAGRRRADRRGTRSRS